MTELVEVFDPVPSWRLSPQVMVRRRSGAWILFFIAWYLLGIPLGPGAPVELR